MKDKSAPAAVKLLPLAPLAEELRQGRLSLPEYIDNSLARIDAYEDGVKALLTEPGRRERLMREAKALEERWPIPKERPLLYGVLLGVKDIFALDGFDTKAGSKLSPSLFKMQEGPVIKALKAQGALVLGKTVTTEFAYFAPGPTSNPWDSARTPGGSSSGSAAGCAAGFFSLALGTQTIGSISRPAAYCGVSGWKPSYDRLSRAGVLPFSPSVDHVGFLSPDVAGLALAAAAVCPGWNQELYKSSSEHFQNKKPVLAVPDGPFLKQAEERAIAAFEEGLGRLKDAGFTIVRLNSFPDIEAINDIHRKICAAEMERTHRPWYEENKHLYAEATVELIEKGCLIGDHSLKEYLQGRFELRKRLEENLKNAGANFWISPSAPGPAPVGLSSTGSPLLNLPWTNSGLPTIAMPGGNFIDAMPIAYQIAGNFGKDEEVLAFGTVLEQLL